MLKKHGIAVVRDLPGVGANLQDHLQIRLTYKASQPVTTNDYLRTPIGKMRMGLQFLLRQAGPIAVGINQAYIFTRADKTAARPDIQFHFGTISSEVPGGPVHTILGLHVVGVSVTAAQPRHGRDRLGRSASAGEDAAQLSRQ